MTQMTADHPSARKQAARDIVMALTKAMRNISFYHRDHPAVVQSLAAASSVADALVASEREFTIKFVDGEIVVDDRPLFEIGSSTGNLVGACRRRGIDSLTLRQGLRAEELAHVIGLLTMEPQEIELLGGPAAVLERQGVRHITVERLRHIAGEQMEASSNTGGPVAPVRARETYVESLDVVRGAMAQARRGAPIDLKPADQAAATLVEAILRQSSAMLGMVAVKNYDEYTFTHMLHITILCLSLGTALGLDRAELKDLGVAALLHDLGKVYVPLEYLRKPGRLTPQELAAIQRHPVDGAIILAGQPEAPPVAALVAFEHHMQANLSGYPKPRRARDLNMYSLMASIADVYDALTTERPYRPPLPPARALRVMNEMPAGTFDSRLLSAFGGLLGKHPPGTMVRLDNGEIAVVSRPNPDDPARPFVRILRRTEEGHTLDQNEIDLSKRDENTQAHLLAISEVLDPRAHDIDVEELLRSLPQTEAY